MSDDLRLDDMPFEQLLDLLRDTVERLDSNELTLDEAVAAYERCVNIANACNAQLDGAELRVSQLSSSVTTLRESADSYRVEARSARRLLFDEDDDLDDLLDLDDE